MIDRYLLALLTTAALAASAHAAGFRDLGKPTFRVNDISGNGNVVVGSGFVAGNYAMILVNGVETRVPDIPGVFTGESDATAVSEDGSVVTGRIEAAGDIDTLRFDNGVTSGLPGPTPDRIDDGYGVSPDGVAIVGSGDNKPVLWLNGGFTQLGDNGTARAVSNGGQIVYGSGTTSLRGAWKWEAGVRTELVLPEAQNPAITDTTSAGDAWVGSLVNQAIVWEDNVTTNLQDLIATDDPDFPVQEFSLARGLSDDKQRIVGWIGGFVNRNFESTAVLWEGAVAHSLNRLLPERYGVDLTGWDLTEALSISRDGQTFSGLGIGPDGEEHAWSFTIPEPAGLASLGLGLLLMVSRGRRPAGA